MNTIYTIGETVYDIIFVNGQPEAAKPGGAMLNTAVSLGRLGMHPQLISEFGHDDIGKLIKQFLTENGVSTNHCYQYSSGQTPVAIALLDHERKASYTFYRNFPTGRLLIDRPHFRQGDLVMFGSYFSISPELKAPVKKILGYAQDSGCLLFYDPNFRKAHLTELEQLREGVVENLSMANIVRGSDEDFSILFGCQSAEDAHHYCPQAILFYTMGSGGCTMITPRGDQRHWESIPIDPVSTIGAGDTFNAGLAYGISRENLTFDTLLHLTPTEWDRVAGIALHMASAVCMSFDNYISHSQSNFLTDGIEN